MFWCGSGNKQREEISTCVVPGAEIRFTIYSRVSQLAPARCGKGHRDRKNADAPNIVVTELELTQLIFGEDVAVSVWGDIIRLMTGV